MRNDADIESLFKEIIEIVENSSKYRAKKEKRNEKKIISHFISFNDACTGNS